MQYSNLTDLYNLVFLHPEEIVCVSVVKVSTFSLGCNYLQARGLSFHWHVDERI